MTMNFGYVYVIQRSGKPSQNFPLSTRSCTIGRSNECDIRVQIPEVSRLHCRIDIEANGRAYLHNLCHPSTLTFLNEEKILSQDVKILNEGDIITVVDRKFRWKYSESSPFASSTCEGSPKSQARGCASPTKSPKSSPNKNAVSVDDDVRNKKVSFGPYLSPEHFDKLLPSATPVKKGEKPNNAPKGLELAEVPRIHDSLRKTKRASIVPNTPVIAEEGTVDTPTRSLLRRRSPTPIKPYLARTLGLPTHNTSSSDEFLIKNKNSPIKLLSPGKRSASADDEETPSKKKRKLSSSPSNSTKEKTPQKSIHSPVSVSPCRKSLIDIGMKLLNTPNKAGKLSMLTPVDKMKTPNKYGNTPVKKTRASEFINSPIKTLTVVNSPKSSTSHDSRRISLVRTPLSLNSPNKPRRKSKSPSTPKGKRSPSVTPKGRKSSSPKAKKSPVVSPRGRKSLAVSPKGRKSLSPKGKKSPIVSSKERKSVSPKGKKSPIVSPKGRKSVSPKGKKSPIASPKGRKSPAVSPKGKKSPVKLATPRGRKPQTPKTSSVKGGKSIKKNASFSASKSKKNATSTLKRYSLSPKSEKFSLVKKMKSPTTSKSKAQRKKLIPKKRLTVKSTGTKTISPQKRKRQSSATPERPVKKVKTSAKTPLKAKVQTPKSSTTGRSWALVLKHGLAAKGAPKRKSVGRPRKIVVRRAVTTQKDKTPPKFDEKIPKDFNFGVGTTGHANSPASIYIFKKNTKTPRVFKKGNKNINFNIEKSTNDGNLEGLSSLLKTPHQLKPLSIRLSKHEEPSVTPANSPISVTSSISSPKFAMSPGTPSSPQSGRKSRASMSIIASPVTPPSGRRGRPSAVFNRSFTTSPSPSKSFTSSSYINASKLGNTTNFDFSSVETPDITEDNFISPLNTPAPINKNTPEGLKRRSTEPKTLNKSNAMIDSDLTTYDFNSIETPNISQDIFVSPVIAKSSNTPKADYSNVAGLKKLLRTPRERTERQQSSNFTDVSRMTVDVIADYTNVTGMKRLLRTPRQKPEEYTEAADFTNVAGVKQLVRTPRQVVEKTPDYSNVTGMKRLLRTPRQKPEDYDNAADFTDVTGLKMLLDRNKQSPLADYTNIRGLKRLMKTPRSNKNYAIDVANLKSLFDDFSSKSPLSDYTNTAGIRKLFKIIKSNSEGDDLNLSGLNALFESNANLDSLSSSTPIPSALSPKNPKDVNELIQSAGRPRRTPRSSKKDLEKENILKDDDITEIYSPRSRRTRKVNIPEDPSVESSPMTKRRGRGRNNISKNEEVADIDKENIETSKKTRSKDVIDVESSSKKDVSTNKDTVQVKKPISPPKIEATKGKSTRRGAKQPTTEIVASDAEEVVVKSTRRTRNQMTAEVEEVTVTSSRSTRGKRKSDDDEEAKVEVKKRCTRVKPAAEDIAVEETSVQPAERRSRRKLKNNEELNGKTDVSKEVSTPKKTRGKKVTFENKDDNTDTVAASPVKRGRRQANKTEADVKKKEESTSTASTRRGRKKVEETESAEQEIEVPSKRKGRKGVSKTTVDNEDAQSTPKKKGSKQSQPVDKVTVEESEEPAKRATRKKTKEVEELHTRVTRQTRSRR